MSDIQKQKYRLTSVLSFGSLPLFIFVYVMIHVKFVLNTLNESKIGNKFYSIPFRKSHIWNIFCRTEFNKINKNDKQFRKTAYLYICIYIVLCIRKSKLEKT